MHLEPADQLLRRAEGRARLPGSDLGEVGALDIGEIRVLAGAAVAHAVALALGPRTRGLLQPPLAHPRAGRQASAAVGCQQASLGQMLRQR